MKKFLCVLVVLLLFVGFTAQAESGEWEFDYSNYILTGYQGAGGAVAVPEEIDGCNVDILGMGLFNDADAITSLTLPSTLKQVESEVASFCDNLTGLVIPEGVQVIGDNCFICNPALTEAVIPASVRYIGNGSFGSNESLRKVTFAGECPVFAGTALDWIAEDAVVYVPDDQYAAYAEALYTAECYAEIQPSGANAVVYDWAIDSILFDFDASTGTITQFTGFDTCVEIPAEIDGVPVRAIGENAFYSNLYLCCLKLPEGLETIGASAFEWCENLVYIEFPSTLKTIESRAFYSGYKGYALDLTAAETIGDEAFAGCPFISDPIDLPDGLKTIGNSAFESCAWLSEVYVPASVETIGERAFADTAMNYLVFEGRTLPEMADNALENCWYLADIDLNNKATKQDMLDMQVKVDALNLDCRVWRMQNPDVDYVDDGLDVYENGVLTAYTGEQSHLRPWDTYDEITVTALGDGVFKSNQTIRYFAVPYNDAFTTIGAEAFADSSVVTVDLFDSVTTINGGAFRNCVNLTELTLPESLEFMGVEALYGCSGMKKLTVLCDPTVLPADLFDVWPADLEIFVGDNATDEQVKYLSEIAGRPFWNPVTRVSEDLPMLDAMPYEPLPGEDFWYDAEFARLDTYLGYELNLVLPWQIDDTLLTMLGGSVMQRASYGDNYEVELPVVSVVIPETYTDIPAYAFANCETIETVICYAPLEMVSDGMFQNCTSLREVIFVNGVGGIGNYIFDNCPNLQTVYVGPYVDAVGEYAFCDEFGEPLWSLDKCITDPALMPDVDALLESVKCDPMPEPTSETEIVPAMPVGEEGAPFFGIWNGIEMAFGGERMKLSDIGMTMTLILLEDGRMIVDEEGIDLSVPGILDNIDAPGWCVENGVAVGDGCTMTIDGDGRLLLDQEGDQLIFVRIGDAPAVDIPAAPAAPSETTASAQNAAPSANAGEGLATEVLYVCDVAYASGFPLYPSQIGEYSVIFHDDGMADLVIANYEVLDLPWTEGVAGSGEAAFIVTYGTEKLAFIWDGAGCSMNFAGSMDVHYVPGV